GGGAAPDRDRGGGAHLGGAVEVLGEEFGDFGFEVFVSEREPDAVGARVHLHLVVPVGPRFGAVAGRPVGPFGADPCARDRTAVVGICDRAFDHAAGDQAGVDVRGHRGAGDG